MNVSIFIGADKADQAAVFATVNLAQTKVNNSLAYDLLSFAKRRTVERVCHEIVVALDREPSGPFKDKIKRLGVATPGRDNETLSQATVVRGILQYMVERETFGAHQQKLIRSDTSSNHSMIRSVRSSCFG